MLAAINEGRPERYLITTDSSQLLIGTAGWNVPPESAPDVPPDGTHLQRYASVLKAAEINSSFHRPHRRSTYLRWRQSVPDDFRFSVKLPKTITHKSRLVGIELLLRDFLDPVRELRETLGCLLVQLPPSLAFDEAVALAFFSLLRSQHEGPVACEPRHASWFTPEVDAFLAGLRVSRVAADPDKPVGAAVAGGYAGLRYYRLHGSPRTYYSSYEGGYLRELAGRIRCEPMGTAVWCIFDNTTLGAAMPNALDLVRLLAG